MRIHILGGPGAGVSTLGRALAASINCPYFDVDDYYWFTQDPLPYKRKRNPDHRRKLLGEDLFAHKQWVLGGALCGWGDVFIPLFDRIVFLETACDVRLNRIQTRESQRYGPERLSSGGDLNRVFEKFLLWAAEYDTNSQNIRSKEEEARWMEAIKVPKITLNGENSTDELVNQFLGLNKTE